MRSRSGDPQHRNGKESFWFSSSSLFLYCDYTLYIGICKEKKSQKIVVVKSSPLEFWHGVCYCHIGRAFGTGFAVACHFGSRGPRSAVLADALPFWHLAQDLLGNPYFGVVTLYRKPS